MTRSKRQRGGRRRAGLAWLRRLGWALAGIFGAHLACVVALRWVDPPTTITMWRAARESRSEGAGEVRYSPIPLEAMGPHAPLAIIAAEDQEFARHRGFDLEAIRDAIEYNRKHAGRKKRGGSTLSQQTAKNVFLWQERTWLRKGLESWFTVVIEFTWGKRRILEMYLNCAEMGRGIFGIEAAARHYFGKSASALSREEAALIAAALPGPRIYNIARPGPWLTRRQQWVVAQMRNIGGDRQIRDVIGRRE